MVDLDAASPTPVRTGPGQRVAFAWFVVFLLLVVVFPVVGFQVASSAEERRCAEAYPDGECDLAGVAGAGAVTAVLAVETGLVCAGLLAWAAWRVVRRWRAGSGAPSLTR